MLGLSAMLLSAHASRVRLMQETGLPAALRLPAMVERKELLTEQSEITELQLSMRSGSIEETVQVYVLPTESDLDRLLATFDVFFEYLRKGRSAQNVSAIAVGDERGDGPLTVLPLTFEADMTEEGLREFLLFMDLAGSLSISDAFTQKETDMLLALTEEENPAALPALEQFLSTDLLRYAREPKAYDEQLQKSFASDGFIGRYKEIASASRLEEFKRLLGASAGSILEKQNLWPLRFMRITKLDQRDLGNGKVHVFVEVEAFGRTN